MTERPQDAAPPGEPRLGPDDLTRDITLPPLPGRPPPVLPRAWSGAPGQAADPATQSADPSPLAPASATQAADPPPSATSSPSDAGPPAVDDEPAAAGQESPTTTAAAGDPPTVAAGLRPVEPPVEQPFDEPTAGVRHPGVAARQSTATFSAPGARVVPPQTAGPVVGPTRRRRRGSSGMDRSRRGPWVVLTLVPVVVIVVAAVLLIWLTQRG